MPTKIEWTDETWSPVRVRVRQDAAAIAQANGYKSLVTIAAKMAGRVGPHCEPVSPGCLNCYAGANNHRCLPANGTGLPYDRRSRDLVEAFVDEKILLQPLGWKRPRKIFVENQSDLFGEWVTDEMLDRVFAVMALCPQHTFQVLTKRPERMLAYLSNLNLRGNIYDEVLCLIHIRDLPAISLPLPNVWLGVSVENQKAADERIPLLLIVQAAKRFISAEPLLGPVDLVEMENTICRFNPLPEGYEKATAFYLDALSGARTCVLENCASRSEADHSIPSIDWVICGGESGPGARPMHPDWARGLRDQCAASGVPFFFKQWGEWTPGENVERTSGAVNTAVWFNDEWLIGMETLSSDEGHRAARERCRVRRRRCAGNATCPPSRPGGDTWNGKRGRLRCRCPRSRTGAASAASCPIWARVWRQRRSRRRRASLPNASRWRTIRSFSSGSGSK